METQVFTTDSIDQASFLSVKVDYPQIVVDRSGRASFQFVDHNSALAAVLDYESGGTCCAKALLKVRAFLYREVSRLTKGVQRGA